MNKDFLQKNRLQIIAVSIILLFTMNILLTFAFQTNNRLKKSNSNFELLSKNINGDDALILTDNHKYFFTLDELDKELFDESDYYFFRHQNIDYLIIGWRIRTNGYTIRLYRINDDLTVDKLSITEAINGLSDMHGGYCTLPKYSNGKFSIQVGDCEFYPISKTKREVYPFVDNTDSTKHIINSIENN